MSGFEWACLITFLCGMTGAALAWDLDKKLAVALRRHLGHEQAGGVTDRPTRISACGLDRASTKTPAQPAGCEIGPRTASPREDPAT